MRELGSEYGTVTGRSRRCGWLDLVALRYAVRVNGIDQLALTKLDVLSHFAELPVCVRYRLPRRRRDRGLPRAPERLPRGAAGLRDAARLGGAARRVRDGRRPARRGAALRRVRRARARRRGDARRHRAPSAHARVLTARVDARRPRRERACSVNGRSGRRPGGASSRRAPSRCLVVERLAPRRRPAGAAERRRPRTRRSRRTRARPRAAPSTSRSPAPGRAPRSPRASGTRQRLGRRPGSIDARLRAVDRREHAPSRRGPTCRPRRRRPARTTRRISATPRRRVGHEGDHELGERGVERLVRPRKLLGRRRRTSTLREPRPQRRDERRRRIGAATTPARRARRAPRERAGARADVEHALARLRRPRSRRTAARAAASSGP